MPHHGCNCYFKANKAHMDALFFYIYLPVPTHSSSFHWWRWRGDRQHSDHQQSFGAGVSGHWNTRTCYQVKIAVPVHKTMQYCLHSNWKMFIFFYLGGIKMAKRSGRVKACGCLPIVGGWLFLAPRSPTRLASSVWPPMRQETTRGTSTWSSMVK